MPRYVAKTYTRRGHHTSTEYNSNQLFNHTVLTCPDDSRPSIAKAAAIKNRFGTTTFTSTRSAPIKQVEEKLNKRKSDTINLSDPFLFSSGGSPQKSVKKIFKTHNKTTTNANYTKSVKETVKLLKNTIKLKTENEEISDESLLDTLKPAVRQPIFKSKSAAKRVNTSRRSSSNFSTNPPKNDLNSEPFCEIFPTSERVSENIPNKLSCNKTQQGSSQLKTFADISCQPSSPETNFNDISSSRKQWQFSASNSSNKTVSSSLFEKDVGPVRKTNSSSNHFSNISNSPASILSQKSDSNLPSTCSLSISEGQSQDDIDCQSNSSTNHNYTTEMAESPSPECVNDDWNFDSDWEPDSGEQEITFSPRKKKLVFKESRNDEASFERDFKSQPSDDKLNNVFHNKNTNISHRHDTKPHKSIFQKRRVVSVKLSHSAAINEIDAFSSRRIFTSPKKTAAVYNPRQWSVEKSENSSDDCDQSVPQTSSLSSSQPNSSHGNHHAPPASKPKKPEEVFTQPLLKRSVTWPHSKNSIFPADENVTKVLVGRNHKPLFTVVRNVKQAHECQEHGETQEFQDDIKYIMDGLKSEKTLSMRCLSLISLASKCLVPAFRMHLRAHGLHSQIFFILRDASEHPSLALLTSAVMFMMSRDRMNVDLEKPILELILTLLQSDMKNAAALGSPATDNKSTDQELLRAQKKVLNIIDQFKQEKGDKALVLNDYSTGQFAMETLLSLTSKRAGEWFKEEIRSLGGLGYIVKTVSECSNLLEDLVEIEESTLEKIKKADRCLRVLENVTYMNIDNQNFLVQYESNLLALSLRKLLFMAKRCIPLYPLDIFKEGDVETVSSGHSLVGLVYSVLRVLMNITNDNEGGCLAVGQLPQLISTLIFFIMQLPKYLPEAQQFDIYVLTLGLLVNLIQHCEENRSLMLSLQTLTPYDRMQRSKSTEAIQALIILFEVRLEIAQNAGEEQDEAVDRVKQKQEEEIKRLKGKKKKLKELTQSLDDNQDLNTPNVTEEFSLVPRHSDDPSLSDDEIEQITNSQEDEHFVKALHKAGHHMEVSIVAAYVALLIGLLIEQDMDLIDRVKNELHEGNFISMIIMLKKFLGFMNLTNPSGCTSGKSIAHVIEILESF